MTCRVIFAISMLLTARLALAQDVVGSWTGMLPRGPIGTGAFADYLLHIFSGPSVRFRLLEERPDTVEYGFRVPVEASHYVVGAGAEWLATGYSGSVQIVRDSDSIGRFTMETNELPPPTSGCEISSVLELQSRQAAPTPLRRALTPGAPLRTESRKAPAHFMISIAFETVDVKGVVSPFYAKLTRRPTPEKSIDPPPSGHGRKDWSGTFIFASGASRYVESKWITIADE
jgi:hypothetical protein